MPGRNLSPAVPVATPFPSASVSSERLEWETAVNDPTRKLGFYFGLTYVFLRFSMLHETLTIFAHVNLYLALITGLPAVVLSLVGGGFKRSIDSRAGKFWLGFLVLFLLSLPFSSWRGQSFQMMSAYVRADFPILFILGGMVLTWKECKMLLWAMALSGICTLAMEKFFSNMDAGGRMSLSGGTIANSNDYAAHLLLLIPFMLWVVLAPVGRVYKIVFLPLLFGSLFIDLKTGSRGALIGLGAGFLLIILKGPGKIRWILGLCGPIALLATFSFLPASVMLRFSGLVGSGPAITAETADQTESAAESSSARRYLLTKSLEYTMSHPVFGIGAGTFSAFEGGMSKIEGKHGQWQETHNAYTQISSELGIPAAFCYIAGILSGLFMLNRTMAKARRDKVPIIVTSAFCCMLSIVMIATAMAFLSLGYRFYMPALTGMAIALDRILRLEFMNPGFTPAPAVSGPRIPSPRNPQRRFVQ